MDVVWEYLSASDIFVFPSFHEGMPNSLLEAAWAGLPAVAFDIPQFVRSMSTPKSSFPFPSSNSGNL